jgi:hypothetical protein
MEMRGKKMKRRKMLIAALTCFILSFICIVGLVYAAPGDGPIQGVWAVRETYAFSNITSNATTYVKSAPGVLAGILVNGGTMGSVTVKDNTALVVGTTIATITSPFAGQVIPFGVNVSNGICIVTADNTNITVIYK